MSTGSFELIGREKELQQLRACLSASRNVLIERHAGDDGALDLHREGGVDGAGDAAVGAAGAVAHRRGAGGLHGDHGRVLSVWVSGPSGAHP
jgi:hypothetical protein